MATDLLAAIAARRRADIRQELAGQTLRELMARATAAPPPRSLAAALAGPGLHVIGEVKRRSPSAGALAEAEVDLTSRARAYAAGGAAAISVLCEPHWFGGSVADIEPVRAASGLPVLAKEFVVDARQLPLLRLMGADAVLLLAALYDDKELARLVALVHDLGMETLLEAHDEQELTRALSTGARLIGLNNRDLRTQRVDLATTARLRTLVPGDRLVIAESGVEDPGIMRTWRALDVDGALVGEALMRSANPAASTAALVAAGRPPADPVELARRPFVKICGITDRAGMLAAVRAGVDAVGLNLVPGTPRFLGLPEARDLADLARAAAAPNRRPAVVAVTADASLDELAAITAAIVPDAIQLSGGEQVDILALLGAPVWKVIHLPAGGGDPASFVASAQEWLDAGAARILLDTAGFGAGGTGKRIDVALAAAAAREVPVILAGGLNAANVATALVSVPALGVDVASGVEYPRVAGVRPTKDPLSVALFAKRARSARADRPHIPAGPTPVPAGLLEADADGRFGLAREFGGRYVPETLMAALEELESAYAVIRADPVFWAELRELLSTYAGRPTALYRADRAGAQILAAAEALYAEGTGSARPPERLRLYLKREDLAHTGAHKINNALGQTLLAKRLGKTRIIAETGAGQHGVATATACALLGLPCVVYMGSADIARQAPNVLRMEALGAEVREVSSGSSTLKDAVNEAMRDWVTNVADTHYVLGSAMGPHPYPTIVRDLQRRIGDEAAAQIVALEGRAPDLALACVGGGSNAIGLFAHFIGIPSVRLVVAEAAGDGIATGRHAAALAGGSPGILHGARSMMLQDADGQVQEAHSASAGLDYPGVGPQLAALAASGRLELAAATDSEAFAAMDAMARAEGILPALETAHAIAVLPRLLAGVAGSGLAYQAEVIVLLGFSGRGDKDLAAFGRWRERAGGASS